MLWQCCRSQDPSAHNEVVQSDYYLFNNHISVINYIKHSAILRYKHTEEYESKAHSTETMISQTELEKFKSVRQKKSSTVNGPNYSYHQIILK